MMKCTPSEAAFTQDKDVRASVRGFTMEGDKEVPITLYEGPGAAAKVIIGPEAASCVRYQLIDVIKTDSDGFVSLSEPSQNCTEEGNPTREGIPSCETVKQFAKKLSGLHLRYVMEGIEVRNDRESHQFGEVNRVHLGFCATKQTDVNATFLCMENRSKVYTKQ